MPVDVGRLVVTVKTDEVVAGFGLKFALDRFGSPLAPSVTVPAKPFSWLTVIV